MQKMRSMVSRCAPRIRSGWDALFFREIPAWGKLLELVAIKYLYVILVLKLLRYKYYPGYGSYGIAFVFWKEIVAGAVFLIVAAAYLRFPVKQRFAQWIIHVLFILYYIPVNSAFSLNNAPWSFFILSNLFFVLLVTAVYLLSTKLADKPAFLRTEGIAQRGGAAEKLLVLFCLVVCVLFVIHKLLYNGLEFSLSGVYENREEYAQYLRDIGGTLYSYVLAVVRYVVTYVMPFAVVVALVRKKPVLLVLAFLAALSMFAVSSEKSKLLMPVIAVGIYICFRFKLLERFCRVFTVGILLVLLVCLAEGFIRGESSVFMLLIRREMYAPAWLNTLYYDFFSANDKLMWTQSVIVLQNILPEVYDQPLLELINNAYFAGTMPSPNTGLFAEAYMHFGAVGVPLYPAILSVILLAVGRILDGYGMAAQGLLTIQMAMNLTNVPVTRTDFVLSCLLFIACLWLIPKIVCAAARLDLKGKLSARCAKGGKRQKNGR